MKYKKKMLRNEYFMTSLEESIAEDDIVRVIDALVDKLDLEKLGLVENERKSNAGCSKYDARDLLKIYIYGYRRGIHSGRKLEDICKYDIRFQWLVGKLQPDANTLNDFRKNNKELIENAKREGKVLNLPYVSETLIDKANELCTLISNMKQADMKAKSTKKGFLTAFDYALLLDDITVKDIIKIDSMVNYSEGITEGYKKVDNCIFGATFETCPKELVPVKMQELVHKYNTEWALDIPAFDFDMDFDTPEEKEQAKETYIRAFYEREAKFHIEFERIHPFEDGNGRTGRIITNAHLLHNNLAPIIITSSMKNIYLNCISNRDYRTLGNLFRMLASVTTSQLIAYYRKVKGISPDDIGEKRGKPNK